jgi:hypothetical protein
LWRSQSQGGGGWRTEGDRRVDAVWEAWNAKLRVDGEDLLVAVRQCAGDGRGHGGELERRLRRAQKKGQRGVAARVGERRAAVSTAVCAGSQLGCDEGGGAALECTATTCTIAMDCVIIIQLNTCEQVANK